MIKRIMFDIDDTLLETKIDARVAYDKFFTKYSFTKNSDELFNELDYFNHNDVTTVEGLYLFLKNFLGDNFNKEVFEDFCNIYEKEATLINENTISVLKYLKSKYEVVAITNWFSKLQIGKLESCGLVDYFDEIYCIDTLGRKPLVETFKKASNGYSFEEIAIVGDSFVSDIKVPRELGMKTFWLTDKENYDTIKSIDELMEEL